MTVSVHCHTDQWWKDLKGVPHRVVGYGCSGSMRECEAFENLVKDWCAENCAHDWEPEGSAVIWFKSNDDATLFRIRFG